MKLNHIGLFEPCYLTSSANCGYFAICRTYYIICVLFGTGRRAYEPNQVLCCVVLLLSLETRLVCWVMWSDTKQDLRLINPQLPFSCICVGKLEREKKKKHSCPGIHLQYFLALFFTYETDWMGKKNCSGQPEWSHQTQRTESSSVQ